MRVLSTSIADVRIVEPVVHGDDRGFFFEAFRADRFAALGLPSRFVQDNVSASRRGVLRGLHFQHPHAQGKLVSVLRGEVFDVAVDVRVGSPTFGRWVGTALSQENRRMLYVPAGFAHGFLVTRDDTLFAYKCTDYYHPEAERSIRWDDPAIGIEWPITDVVLSAKDRDAPPLAAFDAAALPSYGPDGAPELTELPS
ncbi:MAG TPA: dTDP-4-dehydrorhamnose 3,5-epimerase [Gemmatimonadaceae bacterium]|nr:dTDP-4-dehydrorhamnose 3,5-epimerase [Gemmatimonadaceae bacterium]